MKKSIKNTPIAIGEVTLRYTRRKVKITSESITCSQDAERVIRKIYPKGTIEHREIMFALFLSRSNKLMGYAQISSGGLTGTVCDPKIIFQYALQTNASGIILAHNHPSGNLQPSQADIQITEKVREAGKLLDIALLDHLILTGEGFYSLTDNI